MLKFPVPVLASALVRCPFCFCAVMRPDLRVHGVVVHGRPRLEDQERFLTPVRPPEEEPA